MPDGSLIIIGEFGSVANALAISRSTDGGHTWSTAKALIYTPGTTPVNKNEIDVCGFIVDREKGVAYLLYVQNVHPELPADEETERVLKLLITADSGETWSIQSLNDLPTGIYGVSYTDGLKLSCYDGAGSNVDYVYMFALRDNSTKEHSVTSIYSKDDGATWRMSDSRIRYELGNITYKPESGVSEPTVWEQKDGTLIVYARCQVADQRHFAVACSTDHGVTWGDAEDSNIYASNTQPLIGNNGVTPILIWGGNNSHGTMSYSRLPFNIAYSLDDGETYIGILDISHQTPLMNREYDKTSIAINQGNGYSLTNPDVVIFERGGTDCAYILVMHHRILIENFSDYLYKTKGAFDSFERGDYTSEGWIAVSDSDTTGADTPMIVKTGATDGDYAMKIGSNNKLSRSIPYVEKGIVSFDLYVENMAGMTFELQSAYNASAGVSAPITIYVDAQGNITFVDGNGDRTATGLCLQKGANSISVTFDGSENATLTVNGQSAEIFFNAEVGAYACFAYIYTQNGTSVCLDRFTVIDMD